MPELTRARAALAGLAVLCLASAALGCGEKMPLTIRARDAAGNPLKGLAITVLPVDADRILDSLEAAASSPKPRFPELEAEMANYRRGNKPQFAELDRAWQATRDSLAALSDSLHRMNRAAPAYREGYSRLRALYLRFNRLTSERDRAIQAAVGEDLDLARRAARAADSLRRWEGVAFARYAELLSAAVIAAGREPRQAVTDSSGAARVEVEPGRWWLYARLDDPENPFQEFYWSVPIRTNGWVPTVGLLDQKNAVRRWRH
jgi:hypothetical protein